MLLGGGGEYPGVSCETKKLDGVLGRRSTAAVDEDGDVGFGWWGGGWPRRRSAQSEVGFAE